VTIKWLQADTYRPTCAAKRNVQLQGGEPMSHSSNLKRVTVLAAVAAAFGAASLQPVLADAPAERTAAYSALGQLPDWDKGVWQIDWTKLFGPGGRPEPPSLTPEYAAKLAAFKAGQAKGENVQNQNANCIPPGVPQIMQMPYPFEFIFSPGRVTIAIETDSQVRRIWLTAKHPDDPDLTYNGDSIGRWDGGDLVVDTVALEPHTEIAQGVGHSDQIHVVERFHQVDPDRLNVATTITDPKVLTKPWTVTRQYLRHGDWKIMEYVCEQNNHDSADANGRAGFRLESDAAPAPAAH
jgi:hypothetical protein